MIIQDITSFLDSVAPPALQESYDNAGLLTGDGEWFCTGGLVTLDATEEVILEAKEKGFNLVIAHHPIIFSGLKKISPCDYVGKAIIAAIRNDIAIYAIHTNLDNIITGVNGRMADKLGLLNRRVIVGRKNVLKKLVTYVPVAHTDGVRDALFVAGAGNIGNYSECSFNSNGEGTFKPNYSANPFVGEAGTRHTETEMKIEMIFPAWLESRVKKALLKAHPYEEVAYDIFPLENTPDGTGSGLIGELAEQQSEQQFLQMIKEQFGLAIIRHTPLTGKKVKTVALCGGAGSFLIQPAVSLGADFYITSDVKYHEFFDANGKLVIADIGHYESEQFTTDLLFELLSNKFPNFAVQKTQVKTNPVTYFG